jgi:hypothetical protein
MSTQLRCDFNGERIMLDIDRHKIKIDNCNYDCCQECYLGNVNLSEVKKARTRKYAPKIGRPKGKKNKQAQSPAEFVTQLREAAGPEMRRLEQLEDGSYAEVETSTSAPTAFTKIPAVLG